MSRPSRSEAIPLFRDTTGWYLGTGAFWFATSFKWFILFLLLPLQVRTIVPGGEANTAWGQVVALGAIEAMVGPALFGHLSDRTRSRFGRRRPYIALGAGLTALALLYLGGANSLSAMVIGYLLLQISDDVGTGPYASIVPDLVPENHRGKASGILSVMQLVSQVAAAGVGIALASSPTTIYAIIAVLNIACAAIVLVTVRERLPTALEAKETSVPRSSFLEGWLAPWRSSDFRWVWITRFLVALGFYILTNYAVNYMADTVRTFRLGPMTFHKPFEAAVVVALAIALSGAAASVVAGRWTDTFGRKKVIVGSGWVMFAALVPFALIPHYGAVVLLAIVFGAGYGAYLSASWALASDVLPSEAESAKDMGIWQASIATPQILSGAAGALIDLGNRSQPGRGYTIGFLLAAAAFLAGSLLVTRVHGSR